MKTTLRPIITLTSFLEQISQEELENITQALSNAFYEGFNKIGVDEYIPSFRLVYSSCFFAYICGHLQKFASNNPEWTVKRNSMTFILVKNNVCQFHFYKGNRYSAIKPDSKRKHAILFQEEYSSLESLPSVVFQHFSDRANYELLGLKALFYRRGELLESFDVLNSIVLQQSSVKFSQAFSDAEQQVPNWQPKKGKGKKGNQGDLPQSEAS